MDWYVLLYQLVGCLLIIGIAHFCVFQFSQAKRSKINRLEKIQRVYLEKEIDDDFQREIKNDLLTFIHNYNRHEQ